MYIKTDFEEIPIQTNPCIKYVFIALDKPYKFSNWGIMCVLRYGRKQLCDKRVRRRERRGRGLINETKPYESLKHLSFGT